MDARRTTSIAWLILGLAVALYIGWAAVPTSGLYARALGPRRLLALAAVLKLVYLLFAAVWAFLCRDRLDAGNPARPAWFLLSLGLLSTFVGQLCLAPFQLVLGETPFPSVADVYYLLAYPFLIAAFLTFLYAYREAGLPIGSLGERLAIVAGVGLVAVLVAIPILKPVATSGSALLDRILTVAYPLLDLLLLVPLALLLRVALRLRGSRVGDVWLLLLVGAAVMCMGDICFAYFQALGEEHLDPFVHASFILAYGLMAGGAHRQLQILRS
jgi:hypothetical protein